MGDRVAVLRDGVLQQCAAPRELYRDPTNVFVAGFMGSPAMNLFTLPVLNQTVSLGDWIIPIPREVADKILAQHELFRHDRFLAQMSLGPLPHERAMRSLELLGTEVAPLVREGLAAAEAA